MRKVELAGIVVTVITAVAVAYGMLWASGLIK